MWKRDQTAKPTNGQPAAPSVPPPSEHVAMSPIQQAAIPVPESTGQRSETGMVNIGKSVVIKGELRGSEDLTIEGHIEGTIDLKDHVLTIGPNGKINAQVFAKSVVVLGTVQGNITASDKVEIRDGAAVDGDVISPRVAIAEGARFHGSVDMQQKSAQRAHQPAAAAPAKPVQPVGSSAPEHSRAAAAH